MARRHVSFARGPRRATSWFDIPPTLTAFTSAGGTILVSLDPAEKDARPFTIIRTHLEILISSDQLTADEKQIGAIGMCVVSNQAESVGVTAVPTPVSRFEV